MRTEIITAAVIVAAAVIGVKYIERADIESDPAGEDLVMTAAQPAPKMQHAYNNHLGSEVRIAAAHDQQFYVEADVNRSSARFLVDTGASYVALRDSDARDAGIYTSWTDYTYPVRTANGETKAAFVTLEEMEVGGILVKDVKAFVLPDEQLSINLLGMSFLSRIESVNVSPGELVMRG